MWPKMVLISLQTGAGEGGCRPMRNSLSLGATGNMMKNYFPMSNVKTETKVKLGLQRGSAYWCRLAKCFNCWNQIKPEGDFPLYIYIKKKCFLISLSGAYLDFLKGGGWTRWLNCWYHDMYFVPFSLCMFFFNWNDKRIYYDFPERWNQKYIVWHKTKISIRQSFHQHPLPLCP